MELLPINTDGYSPIVLDDESPHSIIPQGWWDNGERKNLLNNESFQLKSLLKLPIL